MIPIGTTFTFNQDNKIYLCGRFSKRFEFRLVREVLKERGYEVTSSWIDQPDSTDPGSFATFQAVARRDLDDLDKCDIVLVDPEPSTKGSMFFEMGYGFANKKRIVIVGESPMLFSSLAHKHYPLGWTYLLFAHLKNGGRI